MNTSPNASLTKMINALQQVQPASKDSKQIYESVLHRHFQIIQTFLQKINALYIKNEELEGSMCAMNEKMEKIETCTQNIHYQFRTTHLMIDKRLNNIMTDYANLAEQFRLIRHDLPVESYLSTENFLNKSAYLKLRKKKEVNGVQNYQTFKSFNNGNYSKDGQKANKFGLTKKSRTCRKLVEGENGSLITLNVRCDESNESEDGEKISVEINDQQEGAVGVNKDELNSIEWIQGQINLQLGTFNKKIKRMIQVLNQENAKAQNEIYSRQIQQQKGVLESGLVSKTQEIKSYCKEKMDKFINEFLEKNEKNNQVIKVIQSKLNQKIDSNFFQQSLTNFSAAVQLQLSKNVKQFSNRIQTERAFDILQDKVDTIIEENSYKNHRQPIMNHNFTKKINKVSSHDKVDFGASEKKMSIEQADYGGCNGIYRSLDFSEVELGTLQQRQHRGNSVHANRAMSLSSNKKTASNQLKPISSSQYSNLQKQRAVSRKYSKNSKNNNGGTSINQNQKGSINEWKQKVVRILSKDGVRKRKVNFR